LLTQERCITTPYKERDDKCYSTPHAAGVPVVDCGCGTGHGSGRQEVEAFGKGERRQGALRLTARACVR